MSDLGDIFHPAAFSGHLGMGSGGSPTRRCRDFRPRCWRTATTGEIASLSGAGDDPRYFQIRSLQTATMQPGKWQDEHRPLVDERGNVIGIVSAKLDASTALAMSGSLPENVNYAVKSSLLLSFLESVPESLRTATMPSSKRPTRRMRSLRRW